MSGAASALWDPDSALARGLALVNERLKEAVKCEEPVVEEVAAHLLSRSGKRLRPALTLLAAGDGEPSDAVVEAASVVELVHVASLYHDDLMDRSTVRRGAPTAHELWGAGVAAFVGSHLFACAGRLAAGLGDAAVAALGCAAEQLYRGQAREVEHRFDTSFSAEEHLQVLAAKTGALFQLAVGLGVGEASASAPRRQALDGYARHLGLSFQLADDVLDLVGDSEEMGKNTGDDVSSGAYSLPLLLTLASGEPCAALLRSVLLREGLDAAELALVRQLVVDSGAVARVRALALREAELAAAQLGALPEDTATRQLRRIAAFSVERVA